MRAGAMVIRNTGIYPHPRKTPYTPKNRASRAFMSESRKELEKMIYLTDEIALTGRDYARNCPGGAQDPAATLAAEVEQAYRP